VPATTTPTTIAYIGLGANLGDAEAAVRAAAQALAALPDTRLCKLSDLYRSSPVDATGPDFVNAVAQLETRMTPLALLHALLAIETQQGRERPYKHAPRTLDLDLLLYGNHRQTTPELTLPHPRLHLRRFVVAPLAEIAPDLHIPGLGALAPMLTATAAQQVLRLSAPNAALQQPNNTAP
jgi:2-amino-4-hydroxy-6-hydroxymethyldihydropteridine diphosphokinase